jgi:hypothetical protein
MTLKGMPMRTLNLLDFIALTESGQFPYLKTNFAHELHSNPPPFVSDGN